KAGMKHPPPLLEETAVGHFLSEGVFKGVDQLGEQTRLVQELGVLAIRETQAELLFRQLPHGLKERQRDLRPNDCGGLEQVLLLWRQAVNARRHAGRD